MMSIFLYGAMMGFWAFCFVVGFNDIPTVYDAACLVCAFYAGVDFTLSIKEAVSGRRR